MRLSMPVSVLIKKILLATVGLAICAVGNYMTIKANIGQSPWNALYLGLINYIPLTYGQISIVIGILITFIALALKEPIGLGTVMDYVLVGIFCDLYETVGLIPEINNYYVGIAAMLVGMAIQSFAQFLYMSAGLSCGPRDAMMVGLGKRVRKVPIGAVSIAINVTAAAVGFLLGGSIGLGTVIFMLAGGVIMQAVFHLLRFEPRDVVHVGFHQLLTKK